MNNGSVLIVGCGQLGNAMAPALTPGKGWRAHGMRRNVSAIATGINAVAADYTNAAGFARVLDELQPDYIVLTLTPAARNEEGYELGYVQPLKNLLAGLSYTPRHIVFVSSTSVYSQHSGEWIDEDSTAEPNGFSGATMLRCEQLLRDSNLSFTALRCGGIYGAGSGRLLAQVRDGQFSSSNHYTNRIHYQDCSAAIVHLLEKHSCGEPVSDTYLCVDSSPCQKQEIEQWLAAQLGVNYSSDPGSASSSSRNPGSKRCDNTRLLASGLTLRYPSYKEGYRAMIDAL